MRSLQKFHEINSFAKESYFRLIWRKIYARSKFCTQCGNYGNLLADFFSKIFVKSTFLKKKFFLLRYHCNNSVQLSFLLKKVISDRFDEKFMRDRNFAHSAEITEICLQTFFPKNFVKSTFLIKKFGCTAIIAKILWN